jgi:hypothetical protein
MSSLARWKRAHSSGRRAGTDLVIRCQYISSVVLISSK